MNYNDYQNQVTSEKITLALVDAAKRLIGFSLESGDVYSLSNISVVVSSIEENGVLLDQVDDLASVVAGSYFYDESVSKLYVQTIDSVHPNGRFITLVQRLHFSNVPIVLPRDLNEGEDVFFEPLVLSSSAFGVEIDTVNQLSEAIEGNGTLTLINDQEFWPKNYDKLVFENQACTIYSYSREMPVTEAKKIFDGAIEGKTYANDKVSLKLNDQLSALRETIPLETIEALALRNDEAQNFAKQRMIIGQALGHLPTNVDHVRDGYPLVGTVSISIGSSSLTGIATEFLRQLSPDDKLVLDEVEYTVASVSSNTALELTEAYTGTSTLVSQTTKVKPDQPKRYINRIWKVAGHAVRQPTTTTTAGSSTTRIAVQSTDDIYDGDELYIGPIGYGSIVSVSKVISGTLFELSTSLESVPAIGTTVLRPAIQNLRIDDIKLRYYRDYTFDADSATLTLSNLAEANVSPTRQLKGTITTTSGSRTVTGIGFEASLRCGDLIGRVGVSEYLEVLSIDSDTQITLRNPATSTGTSTGRYRSLIYDDNEHTLSCDVLGRTIDGTTEGRRIKTVPEAVKYLLYDMGLGHNVDESSFEVAKSRCYEEIGLVIPKTKDDRNAPTYRDAINQLNRSVFGILVQGTDFKFKFENLRPSKPVSAIRLDEADVLDFRVDATAKNMILDANVLYAYREYDPLADNKSFLVYTSRSKNAEYILNTARTRDFDSLLLRESDAKRTAGRWSFLLEYSTGNVTIETKLQTSLVEVGDVIDFTHRKLFERYGSTVKRKLMLVERVSKTGTGVVLECTDFSNSFNRVATITDGAYNFAESDDETKLYGGYITDEYGLIDNDSETSGQNVIW